MKTGKPQNGNACYKSIFGNPTKREVQGNKPVKIHAKMESVQLHPRASK